MCKFGVLGLSCETPAAPKPPGVSHDSPRATIEGPGHQNTTKIPREDLQEREERNEIVAGERRAVRRREGSGEESDGGVVWRKSGRGKERTGGVPNNYNAQRTTHNAQRQQQHNNNTTTTHNTTQHNTTHNHFPPAHTFVVPNATSLHWADGFPYSLQLWGTGP